MKRYKLFIFLSIVIFFLDILFIFINYHHAKKSLKQNLLEQSQSLYTAFNTELESTYENLLLIATLYSEDKHIQQLFLKGKIAVENEGGGAGGLESTKIRQQLLEKALPAWKIAKENFNVRQLHFHLGPGDTTFLRVHHPEKYGDNLENVRFTVVDTNKEHTPRTGFETGRVYSGLRGVVPVFNKQSSNSGDLNRTFIGTLEVGTAFTSMFKHIDANFDAGIAMLLKNVHLKKNIWPDLYEKQYSDSLDVCDCVIEASSRKGVENIINYFKANNVLEQPDSSLNFIKLNKQYFFANFYPFNDYAGDKNRTQQNVGSILIWKDITRQYNTYLTNQKIILAYGLIAFIIIELLLYFSFRFSSSKLESKIKEQQNKIYRKNQLLENSEIKYKDLIESFGDEYFFYIHDTNGIFTYISPSITKVLGYSTSDFMTHYSNYLVPGKINDKTKEHTDNSLKGIKQDSYEVEIYHKNRSIHYLMVTESPQYDDNGNVIGVEGIAKDVTKSRAEYNLLKTRKHTLSMAIENSPLLIIITSANHKIEYVNNFFITITGYGFEEIVGQTIALITKTSTFEQSGFYYEKIWHGELINIKKNGQEFWVEASSTPVFDENNEITHFVIIENDISERRETHNKLVAARNAAEKANRAKSEFLASMSHELRTPLNSIIGFAQLFKFDQNLSETQLKNSEQINDAGQHLLLLINDILDLAKIESEQLKITMGKINLIHLLEECKILIEPLALQKHIKVQFDLSQSNTLVMADFIRLKQCMLNLLSNAVKYTDDRGEIKVYCNPINKEEIRISVSDTGHGIAKENQTQLFEAFNRLGNENSVIEGTGIGLIITKKLIEMMDGNIDFDSQPGKGTTFWLTVKIIADAYITLSDNPSDEAKDIPVEKNKKERLNQHSILYIEDNKSNLTLMQSILSTRDDIELIHAPSAELGIELALAHIPELILMDINLPGMDGYEALKRLKANAITEQIPVIALTANAMKADIEKSEHAGFKYHISKPIDVKNFLTVLNKTIKP